MSMDHAKVLDSCFEVLKAYRIDDIMNLYAIGGQGAEQDIIPFGEGVLEEGENDSKINKLANIK